MFGPCFVNQFFVSSSDHLDGEERGSCFALIVLLVFCGSSPWWCGLVCCV